MFQIKQFCVVVYVVIGVFVDFGIEVDVNFFFGIGLVICIQQFFIYDIVFVIIIVLNEVQFYGILMVIMYSVFLLDCFFCVYD